MNRRFYLIPLIAATALSLSLGACDDNKEETPAGQEQSTTGQTAPDGTAQQQAVPALPISVSNAISHPTGMAGNRPMPAAVFMTLGNPNAADDRIVGASTKVGVAELHDTTVDEKGMAKMRGVDSIVIKGGHSLMLKSSGAHIMLLNMPSTLKEGDTFDVTLDFETAPDLVVPVKVITRNSLTETHQHHTDTPAPSETAPADSAPAPETTPATEEHHEHPAE